MSRRARKIRRRRSQRGPARAVFIVLGITAVVALAAAGSGIGYLVSLANSAPDIAELKPIDQGATSVVYAADGRTRLGFIQGDILRTPVPSAAMPSNVRNATVAIEDRRFYQHAGVDVEGVVRAAIKNVSSGETVQGGSTLTMQLVRNLYQGDRSRTLKRKIREAKLASELEDKHPGRRGKEWVLTQYLNNVPYGTVGGQTAVGHRGRLARVLRQAREQAQAPRGGAARRPSAGALAVQPVPRPEARDRAPQRGPAPDGEGGLHRRSHGARRPARAARREEERVLRQAPRELLLRLRQAGAHPPLRRRPRASRRDEGLHDAQPEAAGRGAQGDRRPPAEPRRPVGRAREHRSEDRPDQGDGLRRRLRGLEVQPRRTGQAPAWVDVQGHGPDGGDPQGRGHQGDDLRLQAAGLLRPGHRHADQGQHRQQQLQRQHDASSRAWCSPTTPSSSSSTSTSGRRRSARPPTTWASRAGSTPTRPRASAASRTASRRSR